MVAPRIRPLDLEETKELKKREAEKASRLEAKTKRVLAIGVARAQSLSPILATTPGPRRRRRRSGDPFDFFGTLFTTPQTLALNPMAELNDIL